MSLSPSSPGQVVERYPIVRDWKLSTQPDVDLAKLTIRAGNYDPIRRIRPASLYPIVQGYKNTAAYGGRIDFWEGLGVASLSLTAAWSPAKALKADERLHLGLDLHSGGWNLRANYNKADFYDLAGPTKQSLKGFEGIVSNKKHLRHGTLRVLDFEWNVAGYAGLDRLPDYQNVSTQTSKFLTAGASLFSSHVRRTLGAVDEEQGVKWKLIAQGNAANGNLYPRAYVTFDYGFLTPLRNSPICIRSGAGKSVGNRDEPFANFYFGGFGNNYVDRLDISRYREYYTFPGVKLNEIGATDFARTQVELESPAAAISQSRHDVAVLQLGAAFGFLRSTGRQSGFHRPCGLRQRRLATRLQDRPRLVSQCDFLRRLRSRPGSWRAEVFRTDAIAETV